MVPFLPPDSSRLARVVVRRNASRAWRCIAGLHAHARAAQERETLRALAATLERLRGRRRHELLYGPEGRSWLSLAERGLALSDPRADALESFDLVADGPWLPRLLPSGRMDGGFQRRARALGREMIRRALRRLPSILAGLTPEDRSFGPLPLDGEEEAEEGRARGEIVLPHAGPVLLRSQEPARALLRGREVLVHSGTGARCAPHRLVPGSMIRLTRATRWSRRGARVGGVPGEGAARLGEALALLDAAWPEAGAEVRAQTFVVVPLSERDTVSTSLPERPGCSYINLEGKSLVDLADDLLHESAHHRLHGLEEIAGPLVDDDGEPRYFSPWRRSIRPLHGILHAAYTFTWRAALLAKLLALRGVRLPRAWIERELRRERVMLGATRADLADAARRGLLTPEGKRLAVAIRRRIERLGRLS